MNILGKTLALISVITAQRIKPFTKTPFMPENMALSSAGRESCKIRYYSVSQKKTIHLTFDHNFRKCRPIFG